MMVGGEAFSKQHSGCHTALTYSTAFGKKGNEFDRLTACLILDWLMCQQLQTNTHTHTFSSELMTVSRSKQFHTHAVIFDQTEQNI